MSKKFIYLSVLIISGMALNLHAESNTDKKKQVLQTIKQLERDQKKLARFFNRLSPAVKQEVIQKTSGKLNSDSDLINDYLETSLKLNKCSSDSDGNGVSDDGEYATQTSFEVHAKIQSINADSLALAGKSYVLNQQTVFLDDDNNNVNISYFTNGKCVEAEGYVNAGSNIVEKLKEDDDC